MLYRKISTDIEVHLRSDNDKIMVVEGARQTKFALCVPSPLHIDPICITAHKGTWRSSHKTE